jgi:hypothetical protein
LTSNAELERVELERGALAVPDAFSDEFALDAAAVHLVAYGYGE